MTNFGVAIGPTAKGTGANGYAAAIGFMAAAGNDGTAVGRQSTAGDSASTQGCTAIGAKSSATHAQSTALGFSATTTKANQVILGRSTETVTMPGKTEIGTGAAMVTLSTRIEGGKAQLVAKFATGDPVIIATEP